MMNPKKLLKKGDLVRFEGDYWLSSLRGTFALVLDDSHVYSFAWKERIIATSREYQESHLVLVSKNKGKKP